ncbi:nucleotide disphospho-sugar-binding domain-containing protein [Actinomadura fibrosa]|uniref:Nucleotide disphospho-sugar-binding domain-containing protein n=1 Tax=Actinomadura fibrosa TaxID=111802 RepID=A0ABW2XIF8_9ACTN|nr:nucleotide disphospho-sugar-binding domain-containing protein [Actinomadura fibrosa]
MFTVSSQATHYSAMVPWGWALQAAGHEVRVLCTPDQTAAVGRTGLLPVPVLDGMKVITRLRLQAYEEAAHGDWPYPWLPPHPLTGETLEDLADFDVAAFRKEVAPVLAERAARSFDAAVAHARAWRPDLILHDPASLEGLLASRVTGVPAALCLWGPVGTHEPEHMRIVPADHSGSFPRHGQGDFSLDMIERVLDPCPPSLDVPVPAERVRFSFVPFNGTTPVPPWALEPPAPGRPRVCVTWSTALTATTGPNSYLLPSVLRALDGLDCEVIVTATAADVAALGPVPDGVRVVEHVPLLTVLPGCAAVVHHGGSGSAMTAFWAGVPQLIATFASEQAATARRVAAAGAGRHLRGHEAGPGALRAAVQDLVTDPAYRENTARLREEMRAQPTPARLVDILEKAHDARSPNLFSSWRESTPSFGNAL